MVAAPSIFGDGAFFFSDLIRASEPPRILRLRQGNIAAEVNVVCGHLRRGGRLFPGLRAAGAIMGAYDEDGALESRGGSGIAYDFGRATGLSVGWGRSFG